MAINHVVLEGYLATKPQMVEPDTLEFILRHHGGTGGTVFGLFLVEAWAGLPHPDFFRSSVGDPILVTGHLTEGVRLDPETTESRSTVKIRAVELKELKRPRRLAPLGLLDESLSGSEEIPF